MDFIGPSMICMEYSFTCSFSHIFNSVFGFSVLMMGINFKEDDSLF